MRRRSRPDGPPRHTRHANAAAHHEGDPINILADSATIIARGNAPDPQDALEHAEDDLRTRIRQLERLDKAEQDQRRDRVVAAARRFAENAAARGDQAGADRRNSLADRYPESSARTGWVADRERSIETVVLDGQLHTVVTIIARIELRD